MVTLIWNIIAWITGSGFPMVVMFIEGIVTFIALVVIVGNTTGDGNVRYGHDGFIDDLRSTLLLSVAMGYVYFSATTMWMDLSLVGWMFLLAPVWFLIAFFFPGGFTLTHVLLSNAGRMDVPTWAWIVNGLLDLLALGVIIFAMVNTFRAKRSKK